MFLGIGNMLPAGDGISEPVILLTSGDSWVGPAEGGGDVGFAQALPNYIPNLTMYNMARSGDPLYGTSKIIEDLEANIASPLGDYTAILLEGGLNDYYYAYYPTVTGTFDIDDLKASLISRIDTCFNAGYYNVTLMSIPTIQDYMDGSTGPGNAWDVMEDNNTAIPSEFAEFDEWAEAYCNAVGVKFMNINQLPFAQNYVAESGMVSVAHPTALGRSTLAQMAAPFLASPAITRKTSHQVILDRPNRELLTVQDMQRITTMVDAVDNEWDKLHEMWIFTSDVTTSGNALTGVKGGEMLARNESGSNGNNATTLTWDSTSGAEGVIFASLNLGRTGVSQADIGRTMAAGIVVQAQGSFSGNVGWMDGGDVFAQLWTLQSRADTHMRGIGLTDGANVEIADDPSTLMGKCVELRSVQLDSTNQTVTLYVSGTPATGVNAGNGISRTYAGALSTQDIVLHGYNFGGGATAFSGETVQQTVSVVYFTDGTHTASTWAAAAESIS